MVSKKTSQKNERGKMLFRIFRYVARKFVLQKKETNTNRI